VGGLGSEERAGPTARDLVEGSEKGARMPYWLYERSSESEPTYTQSVDAELSVFGYKKGLIYHALKDELPVALERRKDFVWVRTASDL
jgi:hypothetical protein